MDVTTAVIGAILIAILVVLLIRAGLLRKR